MTEMLRRRKVQTIKQKLIGLVFGHLLLFSILCYALFFWFQSVLENKISAVAQQTSETLANNVEMYIQNHIRLANTIAGDSGIVKLLRDNPDFSSSQSIWPLVQMMEKMRAYSVVNQYIYSIAIYNVESGKVLSTTDGIFEPPVGGMQWARGFSEGGTPLFVGIDLAGVVPSYVAARSSSMISIVRLLPGRGQENLLMIQSDKKVLDLFVGDIELWQGTDIVISDAEGNEVYATGPSGLVSGSVIEELRTSDDRPYHTIGVGRKSYFVVRNHSDVTGWDVSLVIPQQEIMADLFKMQMIAVGILLGIAVLMLLFIGVLYTQILNPIKLLMQSMVWVEKGLNNFRPVRIKRMDELGFLQQRFNEMIHNEQQMRRTILDEQLHNKEMELKFLQSQVNPHFLYNTLDSIYWVAEERGMEEVSEVVLHLSKFFRLSLSKGKDFLSVKETMEHLQHYISIQQFRHTDKFEVRWEVDDRLRNVQIMKLMLQPVVENAIIHGLERAAEACVLTIRIGRERSYLRCTVANTGVGMDKASLKRLVEEIRKEDGPSGMTYGLRNLYQRLRIQYGEDMGFQVWSKPQEGTRVTIRIRLSRLGGAYLEDEVDPRRG